MIRLLALWLVLLTTPILADPVKVTSGEHDGFTRLVFEFDAPVDWQLGRSTDGYQLRLAGLRPQYDLRQAFDLIGRSRLAAIWVDPEDGSVRVGLACACHAFPFEFRPGVVVLDIKDGPPPKGSGFEVALDGQAVPALSPPAPPRPRSRPAELTAPYRWTDHALTDLDVRPKTTDAARNLVPDASLAPLRNALVEQMARGASKGVVDMAEPAKPAGTEPAGDYPLAQIRIGDAPADVNQPNHSQKSDLAADGSPCKPPEALAFADWGDASLPVSQALAEAMAGLTGEFDKPDTAAVARAVRFDLFLGFGAEARQLIAAFAPDAPEADTWRSLSYLVENEADPSAHFLGQSACEGPAALWAVLANPDLQIGDPVAADSVVLAFSALPLHLRKSLGPTLADRFLALHDSDTARSINSAILRAGGEPGAAVDLISADLAMTEHDPATAEHVAQSALHDSGPAEAEALVALVRARVAQALPVDPDTALALQALLVEQGEEADPELRRAALLADAASGSFDAAFAALPAAAEAEPELWAVTAALAPDADFLKHAVRDAADPIPVLARDSANAVAARLLDLGLPAPANRWLEAAPQPDPWLAARIALALEDGHQALSALTTVTDEGAVALQSQALALLGQEQDRAQLLAATNPAAAQIALARAENWSALATQPDSTWSAVAQRITPTGEMSDATLPVTLQSGKAALTASETARTAVAALLAEVAMPGP